MSLNMLQLLVFIMSPLAVLGIQTEAGYNVTNTLDQDFLWGTATAAYQIEGAAAMDGRLPSIWDTFSHTPGKIRNNETGDVACDHYHKWKQDIQLLKSYGVSAYRFSISWSRLIPHGKKGSRVNRKALRFYNNVIDELLKYNITPLVSLYHWDLPQSLDDAYGGLLNHTRFVSDFVYYAEVAFANFGNRVKYWLTFNEPWTFCNLGYGLGVHAPGRCSNRTQCSQGNTTTEPWLCGHSVVLAHAHAKDLYRRMYQPTQQGKISMALSADWVEPLTNSTEDKAASRRRIDFTLGWFADPMYKGDYPDSMRAQLGDRLPIFTDPERKLLTPNDYFAINHYSSKYGLAPKSAPAPDDLNGNADTTDRDLQGTLIGPVSESFWLNVVPWGFRKMLNYVTQEYDRPDIYVTENGCSVPKENDMTLEAALNDTFRVDYYRGYITAMSQAVALDGASVKGYFAWSLMDNYEWGEGYSVRFGITYVNFTTQERIPKRSSSVLKQLFAKAVKKSSVSHDEQAIQLNSDTDFTSAS